MTFLLAQIGKKVTSAPDEYQIYDLMLPLFNLGGQYLKRIKSK